MNFVDLFAGLGGFHHALKNLGHKCVFACEVDPKLRELYSDNFPDIPQRRILADIRHCKGNIPNHDILCAGFPCQPFSKSGTQKGLKDKTRGTLFHEIVDVLERCRPEYVILENVGNFERHDEGRTWEIVRENLEKLGYDVKGTEHVASGGTGLLSPHHFGFPHSRERFYIVARQGKLSDSLPKGDRSCVTNLANIVQRKAELREQDRIETKLTAQQKDCIDHWNALLSKLPETKVELPSFPIWGDEFEATYPFEKCTPFIAPIKDLRKALNGHTSLSRVPRERLLELLPSYARYEVDQFPRWKVEFIRQNREWFTQHKKYFGKLWLKKLREFPASLRKLEWNCQGEERDLWRYVLQFRPSGLRVKRYSACPSLVAMTSTQIPLLGPQKRFLTRVEGLRLQGFPDTHKLPESRSKTFQALGNAVHVGVVSAIAKKLIPS
jgi:DNA (cytosine-5)-methyltransferase 1